MQFRGSGFNFLNHPLTSFNNQDLGTLNLTAGDCSTCQYTSLSQALQNATITNASSFGYTSYRERREDCGARLQVQLLASRRGRTALPPHLRTEQSGETGNDENGNGNKRDAAGCRLVEA